MNSGRTMRWPCARMTAVLLSGLGIVVALTLVGCRGGAAKQPTYSAEIRRTSFGIPHVRAKDEAGIGYGMGYAYAQDNVCMLSQVMVTVSGERSRYFGPDAIGGPDVESGSIGETNLHSDYFFKLLNSPQLVDTAWRQQKPEVQALMKGYAAGFNRFLADTRMARLPVACRNAPWVRKITEQDIIRFMRRFTVEAGSLYFMKALVAAKPPGEDSEGAVRDDAAVHEPEEQAGLLHPRSLRDRVYQLGSNGVALGKDATENGRGLLLGNPHYPWYGSLRFYQLHLTIPGKLDVMGATLGGFPAIAIGFNRHLAWTHTVNTSQHATLYALQLDSSDPTKYLVDGKPRTMTRRTVTVDVLGKDGALTQRSHDFWMSSYGPIVALQGELDWTARTAYALRDANFDNNRMVEAWYAMNRARSLDELQNAITRIVGIPWVNTLAADAQGGTLYTDVTVVPYLPEAKQHSCIAAQHKKRMEAGLFVLNTGAACEWEVDPAAPQAGIFAGSALPALRRTDFVQNSNDSAWMTNPAAPLTGFAPIASEQDYEQGDRTRIGVSQIQARLAGTDGLPGNRFNAQKLQDIAFSNRSYYGALLHDDLLKICEDTTPVELGEKRVEVKDACAAFRGWDLHANLDSTGYPLATEWLLDLEQQQGIWRVPFSAKDPINTPRGIRLGDPGAIRVVREALARAVLVSREKGIDATRPWGEIQGIELNGQRIPIHGGRTVYNAIVAAESDGLANVRFGASYVQVVAFDANGPQAQGFLTYSQSTDPASPHFADQTPRFSALDWIVLPFTDQQIEADPHYATLSIAE